ncbi:MAG TPA: hypothetical protein VFB60_04800 [Ktedonobacteraceae bacterium]|nr:hypothetical protein [Ktedonobacteraceae bacterium]
MKMHQRVMRAIQPYSLWLALLAAGLVLFPFDWLSEVWPPFGYIFDCVFVTAREHAIGHTTLFLLAGLLVLCSIARLRRAPLLYLLMMLLGSLGEESFQALSTWRMPSYGDGRDLGFDALGFVLAYLLVWGWSLLRDTKE